MRIFLKAFTNLSEKLYFGCINFLFIEKENDFFNPIIDASNLDHYDFAHIIQEGESNHI